MKESIDLDESAVGMTVQDRAAHEAADWFARLCADDTSEDDYEAFNRWRESSSENALAYSRVSAAWDASGDYGDAPRILEMRVGALAERAESGPRKLGLGQISAIAASIALVMSATLFLASGQMPFGGSDTLADSSQLAGADNTAQLAEAPIVEQASRSATVESPDFRSGYSTKVGEMAAFTLPDGSVIELNTGSEVQVRYTAGNRNLTLVQGEAVFTVAKDADRPFVVAAGPSRVVALGTIFSVRRSANEAEVTLIEGRIRVDQDNAREGTRSAQLVAGEQLNIAPNRAFAIKKAELSRVASWRDGRLVFEKTPLRDVLGEFNRYSIEQHVLTDEALGDLMVSGTFRIRSSEHFAATLEAGFPVVVRARSGGAVLEVSSAP